MPDHADGIEVPVGLPQSALDALAQALAAQLAPQLRSPATEPVSPWMDFEAARTYLGYSRDALYKLTAARAIPVRKKQNGQGLRFHRDELDEWMRDQYPRLDRLP